MKHSPLISVIVPTYNRGYIIIEALKSIVAQTLQNFEIIVVDDGSTDNTREIVEAFPDARIRYIKHEENKGLATALNTGFRAARANFLAELSTDDTWTKTDMLELCYNKLYSSPQDVGGVYVGIQKSNIDGSERFSPSEDVEPKEGFLYELFLEGNFTGFQAMVLKKTAFEAVNGVDENLLALQDWDFLIRFSKAHKLLYIPEVMVKIPILEDSITKNQKKRLLYREAIFNKHLEEFRKRPQLFEAHAYRIGNAYALLGNMDKARKYLYMAFAAQPHNIKYMGAFLLSLLHSHTIYKKAGQLHYTRLNKKERD